MSVSGVGLACPYGLNVTRTRPQYYFRSYQERIVESHRNSISFENLICVCSLQYSGNISMRIPRYAIVPTEQQRKNYIVLNDVNSEAHSGKKISRQIKQFIEIH